MQKHFPHILNQLVSPNVKSIHSGGYFGGYFKNKENIKYCKQIWTGFSQDNLTKQAVQLCRGLYQAIKDRDQVLLLRVCSIPLYEKFKTSPKQFKISEQVIDFRFQNLYKIQKNPSNSLSTQNIAQNSSGNQVQSTNSNKQFNEDALTNGEWIRAQFSFKQNGKDNKILDKKLWIQRKVDQQNIPAQNKWYIYEIQT